MRHDRRDAPIGHRLVPIPPTVRSGRECAMRDLLDVIVTLSRVQSDLRIIDAQPDRFPRNGHYDRIVNLTTALQGHTHRWLDDAAARWHAERPSLPVS